tara:strand:- start:656 stop:2050 length:1395 start_codon:yes stop_codon:yes gene_type:complete
MNTKKYNFILDVDSYKVSHFKQYPKSTQNLSAYIEARDLNNQELVFFGLQAFIKKYLLNPITMEDINEAEQFYMDHIGIFNRQDWEYILNQHNGFLPLEIQSIDEGSIVDNPIPLVQIVNTDIKVPWLVSYIETALLRAIWYPTTVSTISREIKKIINHYLSITSTKYEEDLPFKLHDFGARGVSSLESSQIGGAAHLINFLGSDTVEGAIFLRDYYSGEDISYSIPASEHSTITSWGEENELEAHENVIDIFLKEDGKVAASVIDSYNTFDTATNIISNELKSKIINSGGRLVVRPDSGDLPETIIKLLDILSNEKNFGFLWNDKGYKELPDYIRVIQGDGVDKDVINEILLSMQKNKYSANNITFGMGGSLLQKVDRDTFSFAMKVSALHDGVAWRDVYKKPITDKSKNSRGGRFAIMKNQEIKIISEDKEIQNNLLKKRYENGKLFNEIFLDEIRLNAALS